MVDKFNPRILKADQPEQLASELRRIGADVGEMASLVRSELQRLIKLEGVDYAAANALKQTIAPLGGSCILAADVYLGVQRNSDILILGTERCLFDLIEQLRTRKSKTIQPIADALASALSNFSGPRKSMRIGPRAFEWGTRTYVMGILNLSPDSFAGDGLTDVEAAVQRAAQFARDGADLIDLGGESTRPGSEPISVEEVLQRVIPVIERTAQEVEVPISIDTYKAAVARQALAAGAHLINDVGGLRGDPAMAALVAERGVPLILMHQRPPEGSIGVRGGPSAEPYREFLADVIRELRGGIAQAEKAGIAREQIIIDPGMGFGKTPEQNLELIDRLSEFKVLGRPILVGPSRKSFIGAVLDLPVEERLEGTAAAVALAIREGAHMVRVHDVKAMARVARMADAIVRSGGGLIR